MRRAIWCLVFAAACAGRARNDTMLVERAAVVPEGTQLTLRLDEPVSPGRVVVGDLVRAHNVFAVRGPGGEVVIPARAPVLGRVVDRAGAAIWLRIETIEMAGLAQRMRGELVGATLPQGRSALYSDRSVRGELPRGTRLDVRLTRPINSLAALRTRFF
jgi:hypothetical protein